MGQPSGIVLKVMGQHPPIDWLGPGRPGDTDWARQDGVIFGWSESNMRYESAWWLNSDGTPAVGHTMNAQNHIDALMKQRPFDREWLNG